MLNKHKDSKIIIAEAVNKILLSVFPPFRIYFPSDEIVIIFPFTEYPVPEDKDEKSIVSSGFIDKIRAKNKIFFIFFIFIWTIFYLLLILL